MKQSKNLIAVAVAALLFSACQKDAKQLNASNNSESEIASARNPDISNVVGHVYTLSNQTSGNHVLDYTRSSTGSLTYAASYSTGGNGTGAGLGSQGALVLSNNILLAVNTGSNTISSLKISDGGLSVVSTVSSGGMRPISITQYNDLVFVLNNGGAGNISGFTIDDGGNLTAIAGSTRPLSSGMSDPAQISFVQDGRVVVVTEKGTNKIISYTVNGSGIPGSMNFINSAHPTPFGFAVGKDNMIYVTEAAGGAAGASRTSAYYVYADGQISLVTGPLSAGQTAACWAAITNNDKYVYATNTGSNTITSFKNTAQSGFEILNAVAASTAASPIDVITSNNSKFLYVLTGAGHTINAFSIDADGSLNAIQAVPGLPAGAVGLVAK